MVKNLLLELAEILDSRKNFDKYYYYDFDTVAITL